MGALGQHMEFLVFPSADKAGHLIADPKSDGSLTVHLECSSALSTSARKHFATGRLDPKTGSRFPAATTSIRIPAPSSHSGHWTLTLDPRRSLNKTPAGELGFRAGNATMPFQFDSSACCATTLGRVTNNAVLDRELVLSTSADLGQRPLCGSRMVPRHYRSDLTTTNSAQARFGSLKLILRRGVKPNSSPLDRE